MNHAPTEPGNCMTPLQTLAFMEPSGLRVRHAETLRARLFTGQFARLLITRLEVRALPGEPIFYCRGVRAESREPEATTLRLLTRAEDF
jgi:hypothetical protein